MLVFTWMCIQPHGWSNEVVSNFHIFNNVCKGKKRKNGVASHV